jgi:hypothetical protein
MHHALFCLKIALQDLLSGPYTAAVLPWLKRRLASNRRSKTQHSRKRPLARHRAPARLARLQMCNPCPLVAPLSTLQT